MSEQTTQEQIVEMDINLLRTFKDHPFKVTADYPMIQLKESIESCGILTPLLVRPLKDGSYEIISGHRRKHAAQMMGLKTVPVIIRKMGYDDAIVTVMMMVMIPAFLFALYEKDGMYLEQILYNMYKVKFKNPPIRRYETINYYEAEPLKRARRTKSKKGGTTRGK